jgi:Mrp family chromosome partitioning ATPase
MEQIQIALDKARQRYGDLVRPAVFESPRTVSAEGRSQGRSAIPNALSWCELPVADIRVDHLAANRIITADRSSPAYSTFDRLRTKILQDMQQNHWTSVAITSPTAGCGKSLVALNLAFSLGHQDECRTLVVDLDLAQTRMANLLGLDRAPAMGNFLSGRQSVRNTFVQRGDNLAFAANGRPESFTSELLQSASATRVLKETCRELQPTIVIYDMPPMLCGDDVMGFLPQVDCVMMIAAAETSSFAEIDLCERELSDTSNLLGVVLNKCRYI